MLLKKEIAHLETKIRMFEDYILRSKNMAEIEKLRIEIKKMQNTIAMGTR